MSRKKLTKSEGKHYLLLINRVIEEHLGMYTVELRHRFFLAHLKHVMKSKEMSQKALALEINVSEPFISQLLKGKRRGSEEVQEKIAKVFGMDLGEFIEAGKWIEERMPALREDGVNYSPYQFNIFETKRRSNKEISDLPESVAPLPGYLEMFRQAMMLGNKRLMLSVLKEMQMLVDQIEDLEEG